MKVLVVGGAGYIGSMCCKLLSAEGHEPVVFDNFSLGHRDFVKWGPVFEGDILDRPSIDQAMAQHNPEAVMHFAALAVVSESVSHPDKYYRNNVIGTYNLLTSMRDAGVRKLVFSSSCAVYGTKAGGAIADDAECRPVNPYGATKLVCERMMEDFDSAYGIKSFRLRYFNAAGGDPDAEVGEHRENETHVIPLLLDTVAGRREQFHIYGSDYPTPDGTAVRDFIHIMDIADAHLRALDFLFEKKLSDYANLGTGVGNSVLQVVETVENIAGIKVPHTVKARRAGDPAELVARTDKAGALLGWEPKHSDLSRIVEDAWHWHNRRFGKN